MIRVSEGKYRIGDTKVLIFVRVSTTARFINFAVIYGQTVMRKSRLFVCCIEAKDHRFRGKLMVCGGGTRDKIYVFHLKDV